MAATQAQLQALQQQVNNLQDTLKRLLPGTGGPSKHKTDSSCSFGTSTHQTTINPYTKYVGWTADTKEIYFVAGPHRNSKGVDVRYGCDKFDKNISLALELFLDKHPNLKNIIMSSLFNHIPTFVFTIRNIHLLFNGAISPIMNLLNVLNYINLSYYSKRHNTKTYYLMLSLINPSLILKLLSENDFQLKTVNGKSWIESIEERQARTKENLLYPFLDTQNEILKDIIDTINSKQSIISHIKGNNQKGGVSNEVPKTKEEFDNMFKETMKKLNIEIPKDIPSTSAMSSASNIKTDQTEGISSSANVYSKSIGDLKPDLSAVQQVVQMGGKVVLTCTPNAVSIVTKIARQLEAKNQLDDQFKNDVIHLLTQLNANEKTLETMLTSASGQYGGSLTKKYYDNQQGGGQDVLLSTLMERLQQQISQTRPIVNVTKQDNKQFFENLRKMATKSSSSEDDMKWSEDVLDAEHNT